MLETGATNVAQSSHNLWGLGPGKLMSVNNGITESQWYVNDGESLAESERERERCELKPDGRVAEFYPGNAFSRSIPRSDLACDL